MPVLQPEARAVTSSDCAASLPVIVPQTLFCSSRCCNITYAPLLIHLGAKLSPVNSHATASDRIEMDTGVCILRERPDYYALDTSHLVVRADIVPYGFVILADRI